MPGPLRRAAATGAGPRAGSGLVAVIGSVGALGPASLGALVELLLPEQCATCGIGVAFAPWEDTGPRVGGLRSWDRPHFCAACAARLFAQPRLGTVAGGASRGLPQGDDDGLRVVAAAATSSELADVVGAWKYHGVRGLGWPLARALAGVVAPFTAGLDGPVVLVPVPLHRSRQRRRGFNQAAMLAELVGAITGLTVEAGALRRHRATAQQARLVEAQAREANLAGAFAARPPGGIGRALLVDDLVTAGATVRAAAAALATAGWEVAGAAALGLALSRDDSDGPHVDTPDDDL
jgi:predicted amidophosphoribosyltransferase